MLELRNLSAGYRGKALLSGLDITAGRGEMTALIGRNGCGKSTLIRTISGVLEAVSGEIFHDGIPVSGKSRLERARTMSYVGTGRPRAPYLKCREAVAMGRAPWTGWTGHLGEEDRKMLEERVERIMARIPEIDSKIDAVAEGWKTRRMGKVELTILRLAVFEMKEDEQIPEKVAINEAVELAKRFGGDESPSFVNGVLGKVAEQEQKA